MRINLLAMKGLRVFPPKKKPFPGGPALPVGLNVLGLKALNVGDASSEVMLQLAELYSAELSISW
jgi:hypothetical protein